MLYEYHIHIHVCITHLWWWCCTWNWWRSTHVIFVWSSPTLASVPHFHVIERQQPTASCSHCNTHNKQWPVVFNDMMYDCGWFRHVHVAHTSACVMEWASTRSVGSHTLPPLMIALCSCYLVEDELTVVDIGWVWPTTLTWGTDCTRHKIIW